MFAVDTAYEFYFTAGSMEKDKQIVIAHLSDLHLTALDHQGRHKARIFGSLKGMNEAFRNIIKSRPIRDADLIIVTGDITDRGDIETWKFFWNQINAAGLSSRVMVVPGNHDVCCLGARLSFTKKAYRQRDLEKINNGLQIGNQPAQFPWVREYDNRVAVFGLNSNNLGNFTFLSNAKGRIGQDQLLSFAEQLYKHRSAAVKIVVLHHGPNIMEETDVKKRGTKLMGRLMLTGRRIPNRQQRTLLLLCLSHGVQLIAHGHVHKPEDRIVNGVRIVGAPSTTQPISTTSRGNTYQFYTYTIHGQDTRVNTKLEKIQI
jgi:3',5'-cyclic AMP phosphodiesterase CpdA